MITELLVILFSENIRRERHYFTTILCVFFSRNAHNVKDKDQSAGRKKEVITSLIADIDPDAVHPKDPFRDTFMQG